MQHFIDKARSHGKRKEYSDAIKCYDKAIARAPSTQLLDERAECHVQLGDLNAALKDAKASIQHASTDPTGYLRSAKILQKMKKSETALEVMAYGLKRVKHAGTSFVELRAAHDKLSLQLSPQHSIDPLSLLPNELANLVLSYLTFRQRVAIMRVSKGWNRYLRANHDLWQHLDFSQAVRKVRTTAVKAYIDRHRAHITAVTLGSLFDFDKVLEMILRLCPIESLCVTEAAPRLGRSFFNAVQGKASLKALDVHPSHDIPAERLRLLALAMAPRLEALRAGVFGAREPQQHHIFHKIDLPHLKRLELDAKPNLSATQPTANLLDQTELEKLEVLRIHGFGLPALDGVVPAVGQMRNLQHFSLMTSTYMILDRLSLSEKIQSLHLVFYTDYSTALTEAGSVSLNLPKLEDLKLSLTTTVNVKALIATFLGYNVGLTTGQELSKDLNYQTRSSATIPPLSSLKRLCLQLWTAAKNEHGSEDNMLHLLKHPRLQQLNELEIHSISPWDDSDMQHVAEHLQELQVLKLSGLRTVTGVGIQAVMTGIASLRSVQVKDCDAISPDTLAWARERSQRVRFTYSRTSS